MEVIGRQTLWSFDEEGHLHERGNFTVRRGKACVVSDFMDLATKIATLQFKNREFVLLFRGQHRDFKRSRADGNKYSSLAPSLFRNNPSSYDLESRYNRLALAEKILIDEYQDSDFPELDRLQRQRILRWAILQHYEVCSTPLLDVTHSLRIAASFATIGAADSAFIFVLGVPNLSGSVTANAESGVQIVRLSSVCPPQSLRPHLQEGYLLGEYPEMGDYDQKRRYKHIEIDFGRRLIAKFQFNPKKFWRGSPNFPVVDKGALYPNLHDPLYRVSERVKAAFPT